MEESDTVSEPRYPRRSRQPLAAWHAASNAHLIAYQTLSTCDEPTLKEAMSAPPEGRYIWKAAIFEELAS